MDSEAQALIARLRSRPDDLAAYESLKSHYHYGNDFASLANLVEGWAARSPDGRAAADAFHEAARTVSYYLDDQARAIELLESALDRAIDHEDAKADLERLLESVGDAGARVRSLERRARRLAAIGSDPVVVAAVHFELGELWEKTIEQPERAIAHYRTAFEIDPEHLPAMYAAREIYRTTGDLRTAAQVYELEIGAERDLTRQVMLLRELAHLHAEGLSDPDGSIAALDRALGQMPHDSEVRYELAGALLKRAGTRGDSPEAIDDRRRAAGMLVRLAQSTEGETQVAFLESALDAAPDSDEALTLLEQVAAAMRAEDRLPLRWIRYLGMAPTGAHAAPRRMKLASAYRAAGQTEDAIACLLPIAKLPDAARMLREMRGDAPSTEAALPPEPAPAAKPVKAEPTKAEPTKAEPVAAKAEPAKAEPARASTPPSAETAPAKRVSVPPPPPPSVPPPKAAEDELDPSVPRDRDARAKQKQAQRLGQRWEELARFLRWEALREDEADARKSAALSLDELTTRASLDPALAIEALAAVQRERSDDAAVRDRLLARLLDADRKREALPLLVAKADTTEALPERTSLLDRAATIREELGDLPGAIELLERWLKAEPGAAAAATRAMALAERSGDPLLLSRALSREANGSEGDARAAWLLKLADVHERQLDAPDSAIDALRAATEAAPADEAVRLALEGALGRAGRHQELVESLRHRAERSASDDAKIALLREVARLAEHELGDRALAAQAHGGVRAVREDTDALAWLVAEARTTHDEAGLTTLLAAQYEASAEPAAKTRIGLELAQRLEGDQVERARALLEALRDLAPDATPVLDHLARIYERVGDSAALGSAWAGLLERVDDEKRSLELAKKLHQLATRTLASEPLAAQALARWSALAPSELAPLEALVQLHLGAGRERDAADALLELGKRLDSPSEAEAKLLEASDRYETAGDLAAAMDAARLARSLGFGSRDARDRLYAVAEKASRFDVVLELADERAKETAGARDATPASVIEGWLACATIARQKLDDPRKAETYLLRASELAEGDAELVTRVEAKASELDHAASDASAMLERALVGRLLARARTEEGDVQIERIARAARILADAIGDLDAAYKLLVESTVEEAVPTLLEALVDVAKRSAKIAELEKLLRTRFDDCVDGDAARRLLEATVLLYERVGRESEAADVLQRMFTMRPTPEGRDRLLEALARAGRHADRVHVLENVSRRSSSQDERIELGKRIALIWENELANKLEAMDAWKRVARLAPSDADALEALDRLGIKRASLQPSRPTTASGSTALPSGSRSLPPPPPPAAAKAPSIPPPLPPPAKVPTFTPSTEERLASEPPPPGIKTPAIPAPEELLETPTIPPPPGAPSFADHPEALPPLEAPTTTPTIAQHEVEDLEDFEAVEDLDALEDVTDAPADHVRQHVSLPPPLPPRER